MGIRRLRVEIEMENEMFEAAEGRAVKSALNHLKDEIDGATYGGYGKLPDSWTTVLRDSNGNVCGRATVTETEDDTDDNAVNQRAVLEAIRCQGNRGATFEWIKSRTLSDTKLIAETLAELVTADKVRLRLVRPGEGRYYLAEKQEDKR